MKSYPLPSHCRGSWAALLRLRVDKVDWLHRPLGRNQQSWIDWPDDRSPCSARVGVRGGGDRVTLERERERERERADANLGSGEKLRQGAAAATRGGGEERRRRRGAAAILLPSREKSVGPRKPGRGTADLIGRLPLVIINHLVSTGRCNWSGTTGASPARPAPPQVRVLECVY